jgi:hypothetical protein
MSNIFPPKLMPQLEPLPEKNDIHPLDYVSNSIPSYPPMQTPKLQDLQNETITYPEFRNEKSVVSIIYPAKQAIGASEIIREIKKEKKIIKKEEPKPKEIKKLKEPRSRENELNIIVLYIILIILIYYTLQIIF